LDRRGDDIDASKSPFENSCIARPNFGNAATSAVANRRVLLAITLSPLDPPI
jgi:hypothetical protein